MRAPELLSHPSEIFWGGIHLSSMRIEERLFIAAPVERVWSLIGEPARMPGLSPELRRITWVGAPNPTAGGAFRGHNGVGPVRWRTRNVIEVADPGRIFAWRTMDGPGYSFVSRWTYRLEPQTGGCEITERFETASWLAAFITGALLWGRGRMLRRGMRTTLRSIKAAAEDGTRGAEPSRV